MENEVTITFNEPTTTFPSYEWLTFWGNSDEIPQTALPDTWNAAYENREHFGDFFSRMVRKNDVPPS